jgi:hypothetical protein
VSAVGSCFSGGELDIGTECDCMNDFLVVAGELR